VNLLLANTERAKEGKKQYLEEISKGKEIKGCRNGESFKENIFGLG